MLSVTFMTILTCFTCHEKKQILDHVIHDVLRVQKQVSACFGERHQNHCFLIVIVIHLPEGIAIKGSLWIAVNAPQTMTKLCPDLKVGVRQSKVYRSSLFCLTVSCHEVFPTSNIDSFVQITFSHSSQIHFWCFDANSNLLCL